MSPPTLYPGGPTLTAGSTYKVLATAPYDYPSGGRVRTRGVPFVADMGDQNSTHLSIGMSRGHIVEVIDLLGAVDTTGAAYTAIVAETTRTEAQLKAFLGGHSDGREARMETVADAALDAEQAAEVAVEGAPTITTALAVGGTTVAGKCYATVGTTVTVFVNGVSAGTAVTNGTFDYTRSVPALAGGDVVTASAALANSVTSNVVTAPTVVFTAPVVTGPIANNATTVTGTLTAANGTPITVYKAGSTVIGTTTITANAWSATVSAVVTGNLVTAKAGAGASLSAVSNTITVS